jgi:hypothetical protein
MGREITHDLVDEQTGDRVATFTGQVPRVGEQVEVHDESAPRNEIRKVIAVTWLMAGGGGSHARVVLGPPVPA